MIGLLVENHLYFGYIISFAAADQTSGLFTTENGDVLQEMPYCFTVFTLVTLAVLL